ncbi:amino acid adenylation domain-containing protein [Actinoplanes sp. HUAS TT8]|uniref:amino acid adenylation domain-containing protein n=1 Tax=Actinoplanes sp. HUAS TT8 TaxID=3447453 RepID=UPI003F5227C5
MTSLESSVENRRRELLRQRLSGTGTGRRNDIPRRDRDSPPELSLGQEQLWFLSRLEPDSPEYLVPLVARLTGDLDLDALNRAWHGLLRRHEILRTRYAMIDGSPRQIIDEYDTGRAGDLVVVDVSGSAAPEVELTGRLEAMIHRSIDLENEWPVRAQLIRTAPGEQVLAFVFHHIACDAWSLGAFGAELGALYRGAEPAGLPIQYSDFAAWQRGSAKHDEHLEYWRGALADLEPVELGYDRPRPPVRDAAGAVLDVEIPAELGERLRAVSTGQNATLFMTLMAGFQVLLHRHTGKADIPVGTMVSGRDRPELQNLIGYLINSLVIRTRWDGVPTFTQLLATVRDTVHDAFDHQDVPFARLVDALQPERDMSRSPLFQVAFTLQKDRSKVLDLPGVDTAPVDAASTVSRFDLTVVVSERADGSLGVQFEYATALFDRSTVARLAGHYLRLLQSVADEPGALIANLRFLESDEQEIVGGGEVEDSVVIECVNQPFERRVEIEPDAVAVSFRGATLTYHELNARANRLARHLRTLGAGPDAVVAVSLARGLDLVTTLLAVAKAGAAYLPLDPDQPADRRQFMLDDGAAGILVTDSSLGGEVEFAGPRVWLDDAAAEIATYSEANLDQHAGPDNLIYVIYTSGSTGRPKGVCMTHRNVMRLFSATERHFHFGDRDVWALFHSYAFDMSVWELWGALHYGGHLAVAPSEILRSPDDFVDFLVENRVTCLNQTPSAFGGLIGLAREHDPRIDRLALRVVTFGGEKLEMADLRPWAAARDLATTRLINLYGITETTVHTTYHQVTDEDLASTANPIGRPIADLRVVLLDQYGDLAPIGVPGEICVGGPGVARGYHGRHGLTAERFVPDPAGPGRLYRSGDLARRTADGGLDFVGRADHQVKIRGYRVELGEVEVVLIEQPSIAEAAVVVRDDVLVAYVVPAGEPVVIADVRTALHQRLPEYMVPTAFVELAALPLTANGKLDRRALPAPDRTGTGIGAEFVAPGTAVEEQLAAVWRITLGVDRVGVHDSFFDLGGNSIRAVAAVGELRANGVNIEVRDVFTHRTVAELASLLAHRPGRVVTGEPVAPFALISAADRQNLPAGVADAYPLSQIQAGMVVEMQADASVRAYHNVTSFRLIDELPFDGEVFRTAAAILADRHEALRSSIELHGYEVPMQLVHRTAEIGVQLHDLRGQDEAAVTESLHRFTEQERNRPFDITTPSLVRLAAHACDGGAWWVTISECHAVIEGWSHHTLLMELLQTYRSLRRGTAVTGPELPPYRFADFIAQEQQALADPSHLDYWRQVLSGRSRLTLPTGWGNGRSDWTHTQYTYAFTDLLPGLRRLASSAKASYKSVVLAAHLKVMSQLTAESSFVTGLVVHGRPEIVGSERVYGMYLNSVPFAYDAGAATWRDLVARVYRQETEVWSHRHFPMPAIARELGSGERLLDVRFSLHDFNQVDTELVDYAASIDDSPTEFPLAVLVRLGHVVLSVDDRWLTGESADRIGAMYLAVLASMAEDAGNDATAAYLPAAERARELRDFNPVTDEPVEESVLTRFEMTATARPAALAATGSDLHYSYLELDRRANRLARHLVSLGVEPESLVGVQLDRTPDLMVALLAVWKAGAAYVPLDPSYPAERIKLMVADAGARVLVTQAGYTSATVGVEQLVLVDDHRERIAAHPDTPLDVANDLDNLAYVIFTSGSTGRPKGVQISHRSLANHVRWAARELASRGTGGAPVFSSVAFDLVVPNLWAPLVAGQPVFLVSHRVDMADVGSLLAAAGPFSFIKLTPGHLDMLSHQLSAEQAGALAEVMVVAGEPFTRSVLRRWRDLDGRTTLINEYGPTEAAVGTCIYPVTSDEPEVQPIGRPLPGMAMYVLDDAMEPVAPGVIGELYVGGVGVARGYAGDPARTAQRFLPDPYGEPGSRLYRTGDLVRRNATGDVEFLGRTDEQVKIRGYRVELGEIGAVLTDQAGVEAAAVLAVDGEIVAFVTAADEATIDALPAACRDRLPEFMVPTRIVRVDQLPLNANGKVDRRSLLALDVAPAVPVEKPGPRNAVEQQILEVWQRVLERMDIGIHDKFFDIGGHSIRAVALVGALRKAGFDAGVQHVFQYGTIAELAEFIGGTPERPEEFVEPFQLLTAADRAAVPEGVVDAYPMSQVQLGMIAEMLADPELNKYHNANTFPVADDERFSIEALRRAVELSVERHEMLRTSFHLDGFSVPVQLVHPAAQMSITVHDLGTATERELREAHTDFAIAERAAVFDIADRPLMRLAVHLSGGTDWWLSATYCHAITEGWTLRVWLDELLATYRQIRAGQEPTPPALPQVRYADFIAAELDSLAGTEDRDYWRTVLAGHAKFELPGGWGQSAQDSFIVVVPYADVRDDLELLAKTAGASLKSVLLAAHLTVIGGLTTADAFYTGLVSSARPESEGAERVFGMYINTLPFPYERAPRSWVEAVRAVFATEGDVWAHRHLPMPTIQREAGGGRLIDVMFSYRDFGDNETVLSEDGPSSDENVVDGVNEFPLAVATIRGHLALTVDGRAMDRASAERLAGMYRGVLEAMVADPAGPAVAPAAAEEHLVDINDTAVQW